MRYQLITILREKCYLFLQSKVTISCREIRICFTKERNNTFLIIKAIDASFCNEIIHLINC